MQDDLSNAYGDDTKANSLCKTATAICNELFLLAPQRGYNPYDIRQRFTTPDSPAAYQEYLNNAAVLASIGARVNFTESNTYVYRGFAETGDLSRDDAIDELAALLARGVRVALIYGDADYICNWQGGQAISDALAASLPLFPPTLSTSATTSNSSSYAASFSSAGLAPIVVNSTYIGGSVRQYGNLSFSRIYDAGHFVPYYQPETAFQIFARIILGHDLSTGQTINSTTFRTPGDPSPSPHTNAVPATPKQTCWVRSWNASCSTDDTAAMLSGKGLVRNGIYYQDQASIVLPSSTVVAGLPGQPMPTNFSGAVMFSSMMDGGGSRTSSQLTGVYTATGTSVSVPAGAGSRFGDVPMMLWVLIGTIMGVVTSGF